MRQSDAVTSAPWRRNSSSPARPPATPAVHVPASRPVSISRGWSPTIRQCPGGQPSTSRARNRWSGSGLTRSTWSRANRQRQYFSTSGNTMATARAQFRVITAAPTPSRLISRNMGRTKGNNPALAAASISMASIISKHRRRNSTAPAGFIPASLSPSLSSHSKARREPAPGFSGKYSTAISAIACRMAPKSMADSAKTPSKSKTTARSLGLISASPGLARQ